METSRYRIEYDVGIEEKLRKLPKEMLRRIKEAIERRLTIAPNELGKPLVSKWRGYRRLRVGDYRIIYKVYENRVMVFIIDIDHRKEIYDN